MSKAISLTPEVRAFLHAWPTGEERSYTLRLDMNQVGRWGRSYLSHERIPRLVTAGYLQLREETAPPQKTYYATRTDKKVSLYTPRPDLRRKLLLFPWNSYDHWEYLFKHHPARVFRTQLVQLSGGPRNYFQRIGTNYDEWSARLAMPVIIETLRSLQRMRSALCWLFKVQHKDKPTFTEFPDEARPWFATGLGIRMVLLDMLLEPVFNDRGECIAFEAMDPDKAAQELREITGKGDDLADKYFSYMDSHGQNAQHKSGCKRLSC